jgi:hypothetical protein
MIFGGKTAPVTIIIHSAYQHENRIELLTEYNTVELSLGPSALVRIICLVVSDGLMKDVVRPGPHMRYLIRRRNHGYQWKGNRSSPYLQQKIDSLGKHLTP